MTRSRNLLLALALVLGASACVVRGSGSGYVGVSSTPVVYQEPPPPQVETVSARPGYVWVRGRWDWRGGQWTWVGGHWQRQRAGYMWREGRWERRGNSWHWVEGSWAMGTPAEGVRGPAPDTTHASGGVVVSGGSDVPDTTDSSGGVAVSGSGGASVHVGGGAGGGDLTVTVGGVVYPRRPPPAERVESYGSPRAGFIWVRGRWDWRNGQWVWVDGYWERQRRNMVWIPGRWELRGDYYVWVDGRWGTQAEAQGSGGVRVRDHR